MALNIAVPLTTVGDLMDGFGLLSPISPLSVDCRGVIAAAAAAAAGTHKKQMVSPVGSESSGVSSLDSDEMKKPTSPPTTPTEEVDRPTASSPLPSEETIVQDSSRSSSESSSSSARSSLSSTSSESESSGASSEQESSEVVAAAADEPELPELPPKEYKLVLGGRDVLNLMDNLTAPNHFRLQFAQLPENDNIHFFLDNRSQYHRLGANGHIQEYTMVGCKRCDFRYPVNGTSLTSSGPTATMGQGSLAAAFPQQQQQQQQQLQWNNLNSIANSRDKMSLNATANAFTSSKTFGGGNQYFRGGSNNAMAAAAAAPLFGRDSNRGGAAANFLTSTGTTYNNHKTYQQQQLQNFSGGKFNNYQQQQQFFSKNQQQQQQLRYGQSSGGFNAMAAALAANQSQLANFNGKGSGANNMFAYYKTMM
uniref:Uncharacterized protein n=1 Tax=Culex tarsalis TaxID=7177 RepID=A0A1Q3EVX6_CULTA